MPNAKIHIVMQRKHNEQKVSTRSRKMKKKKTENSTGELKNKAVKQQENILSFRSQAATATRKSNFRSCFSIVGIFSSAFLLLFPAAVCSQYEHSRALSLLIWMLIIFFLLLIIIISFLEQLFVLPFYCELSLPLSISFVHIFLIILFLSFYIFYLSRYCSFLYVYIAILHFFCRLLLFNIQAIQPRTLFMSSN